MSSYSSSSDGDTSGNGEHYPHETQGQNNVEGIPKNENVKKMKEFIQANLIVKHSLSRSCFFNIVYYF